MIDWEDILKQHGPLVWRTVYRLLGAGGAEVADCFQETFVSALDFSKRKVVNNWPGLLTRIATTRALDALDRRRTESRRRTRIGPDDLDRIATNRTGPEQAAEDAEWMACFRTALRDLAPGQREVFCLRHLSEMSYEDIAQETGTTANAVGITLHRARARLREALVAARAAGGRLAKPDVKLPTESAANRTND